MSHNFCTFVYARSTGAFRKDDRCSSLVEAGGTYCAQHRLATKRKNSEREVRADARRSLTVEQSIEELRKRVGDIERMIAIQASFAFVPPTVELTARQAGAINNMLHDVAAQRVTQETFMTSLEATMFDDIVAMRVYRSLHRKFNFMVTGVDATVRDNFLQRFAAPVQVAQVAAAAQPDSADSGEYFD
jgi:hypothetical protein